jgi:DNA-binding PucR family transcriptional regulator
MPSGSIGAALDPVGLVLIPDPEGPGRPARVRAALRDRRAVLGPTVAWEDASVSAQRALLGWSVHSAGGLGEDRLARTDDHLLTLLLATSPRLTADLVARRLGALADMTSAARERAIATLQVWLDAHGDVPVAAKMLQVHPQTVRYRLSGLRALLGDGALDHPIARLELALALQAATAFNARSSDADGDAPTSHGSDASDGPPPGSA